VIYSHVPLTAREPRRGLTRIAIGASLAVAGGRQDRPRGRCALVSSEDAAAATAEGGNSITYEASRSCCASGRVCSFFKVRFSICLTRSRVMLKARPTSSSVRWRPPVMP
jgi:hypothetical protein